MYNSGDSGDGAAPKPNLGPPPPPKNPAAPKHTEGATGGGGTDQTGNYSGGTHADTGSHTSTVTPTNPGTDAILGMDPNYQQLLGFDTAASADDLATMNAHISQMQGYYGSDSDPLSVLGRIYQAYQDKNMYIANTLAGHGMINSGETGWQASRATLAYQQQELDARMKLQDYIQGLQDAFKLAERNRKFNEMQAGWTAVQQWLANNQPVTTSLPGTSEPGSSGPGSPPPPPPSSAPAGGGQPAPGYWLNSY